MLGAILGDIIGSPYEFTKNNIKTTEFPLFSERSRFTDDTVMTLAVAEGVMNGNGDEDRTRTEIISSMRKYGRMYHRVGYGERFFYWVTAKTVQKPYGSYGNGSAMRVSSVAWFFHDLKTVEKFAKISAEVTHNHPEGIKGAQAAAAAIFMARDGKTQAQIRHYIETRYQYDLSRTPEMIRPEYTHMASCQETVPEAIIAFLHSDGFEHAIRVAVSLGGDSDTLAAITGGIAEAAYGLPKALADKGLSYLDAPLRAVYDRWRDFIRL
jgi:ADP-ribosylglycohydrolase